MANINDSAGWSIEKSKQVARKETEITCNYLKREIAGDELALSKAIKELKESRFSYDDQLYMAFSLGIFIGTILRTRLEG